MFTSNLVLFWNSRCNRCIHFEFWREEVSDEQKRLYARKLKYDLIVHDMPVPELIVDQQSALRDVMQMEHQYWKFNLEIKAWDLGQLLVQTKAWAKALLLKPAQIELVFLHMTINWL